MTLHRTLNLLLYFLCCPFTFIDSYVLLYNTENSLSRQYYDCVYYTASAIGGNIQGVKYCRQLNESQPLQRNFNQSCYNGGELWSFEELSLQKIPVSDVLQWSSSMEQADRYSKYLLFNGSVDVTNNYICNCTNLASFGKFCEYKFYDGSHSFDEAVYTIFEPLDSIEEYFDNIFVGSQLHNNRPCYTTWTCDSGSMCLDWRHICDGKQQCMDGLDEDFCEMLEFNECEDDEYRCANGMCIPEEYWLDGDYDCMDWTDEMQILVGSGDDCFTLPSFVCDEHLCPYSQWSCGDGQCLNEDTDRHEGVRFNVEYLCKNLRDINYMCEAVTRNSKSWWTIKGGYCLPYPLAYQSLALDTLANTSECAFAVKCALSDSLNQDCPCKNTTTCGESVNESCTDPFLLYPESGLLLSAYTGMMYVRERDWTEKKPDRILYHGRIKCVGYQLITKGARRWSTDEPFQFYRYRLSENRLCNMPEQTRAYRNYSGPRYDIHCWNNSKTFNNRSYQVSFRCQTRCISAYRVRDGIRDCQKSDESVTINNSCSQIQRHRLQCSSSELSCLLAGEIGNLGASCSNERDEFDDTSGAVMDRTLICEQRTDPGCVYLRNYIRRSSSNDTNEPTKIDNTISDDHSTTAIPFRSYCDSFFNIRSGVDELPEFCKEWICAMDQYRCLSGQCISQSWICDEEWDCSDGSDEQRIFIMDHFDEHNSQLMDFADVKEECGQIYRSDNTPFSDICNISSEYPCFRTGIDDPFNLALHRPCINLSQIGDGKTDCLTGLDERNLLQCSGHGMLGFSFQFNDSLCGTYRKLCTTYPWVSNVSIAYDTVCFHREKLYKDGTASDCDGVRDVMCLDDVCYENARCDGEVDCTYGEDEYRCIPKGLSYLDYREDKKGTQSIRLRLSDYPSLISLKDQVYPHNNTDSDLSFNIPTENEKSNATANSTYQTVRDALPVGTITFEEYYLPFICNRGVPVKYYTGDTVCFCPPSFYGAQCEFYSDRITIVTHLDLANYRPSSDQIAVIKVLTTFLFQDQIIDYYEFHVNPQLQNENNYIKQGIYFLYPRTERFIQMKQNNRSGTQLYSVRFEAFDLHQNGTILPIGVWQYPIYFDFLPASRLSKILRFPSSILDGPCSTNPCGESGICQEIINLNHSSYFCSCRSGYFGTHCEDYDQACKNYCSVNSICKPTLRQILTEDQHPWCLCPASIFGHSCHLENNHCPTRPCLNGGSCIVAYDLADTNSYVCLCTDLFDGDHCEFPKGMVNIALILSANSTLKTADVAATTISYSDYDKQSLRFHVRYQQVYDALPTHLKLVYNHKLLSRAPTIGLIKVYGLHYQSEEPRYHVLYYYPDQKDVNITVDLTPENHCTLVETMEIPEYATINLTTSVYFYHQICRAKQNTSTTFTCFRDLNYLCICEPDHYRTECFGYNRSLDQCTLCLSNGYCLKGELEDTSDFLCRCPHCHHGRICQYSTKFMGFTLDSLIVKDIQSNHRVSSGFYIAVTLLIFFFGFINNLCSFLTFIRPKSRKVTVGNYLLIVSIVDQCSLLFLLFKVVHIVLSSNGTLFHYERLNLYSCKIVSYLLSVFTRITYWLTSFVTTARLLTVFFPTPITAKNSHRTLGWSILVILIISSMHVHEVLYYTTIVDPSYTSVNVTICAISYANSFVSTYNQINVLVHYFVPFLIQVISITVLIIQITIIRARTNGTRQQTFLDLFKTQLKTQKEQYITPIIIIFSALPQAILSFSYACSELKQSWQRYTLLTAYLLSFLPQMLGFILYVLSSTTYSEEFRQTIIGKRFQRTLAIRRQDQLFNHCRTEQQDEKYLNVNQKNKTIQ